jgi:N-acetylmuramoyl-L-alanine amidase
VLVALVVIAVAAPVAAAERAIHRSPGPSISVAQIEARNGVPIRRALSASRTPAPRHARATITASGARPTPPRPPIRTMLIPFPTKRRLERRAYSTRHYGIRSYLLVGPHVIVEHFTDTAAFRPVWNTFAPDVPDYGLHELPNVCAHFVIDRNGTIYQLVPLNLMCRHTVGLNYTAIGIEHVGFSDRQILNNPRQLRASLALTRWLRCRYRVPIKDVIGHNESVTSPYHHELVRSLRTQTHDDWKKADMDVYRRRLALLGC